MQGQSVVIIRSSYSNYGGIEKVALDVIKAMLEYNVEVKLLTWDPDAWPIAHAKLQIVPIGLKKGPRFLQAASFNKGVAGFVKQHRPERVFSFDRVTLFTHLHGGGGTHRSFLRIKNDASSLLSRLFRRLSLFHRYTLHVEKKGLLNPHLKKVQCASSLVKKDIVADYGLSDDKLEVIPNGMDWQAMGTLFEQRRKMAKRLLNRHGLDSTRDYLLFLGSGWDRKGLDIAIQGLAGMPENYDLLVVGKGNAAPYKQLAQKQAVGDRIIFLGPQKKGWVYSVLCKALVLPSLYEPFGIAPAEANAMGIPVLVSERTGYRDWISEGKNGVVLELPADRPNIQDAFSRLHRVIESPALSAEQIREGAMLLDYEALMHQLLFDFLELKPHP